MENVKAAEVVSGTVMTDAEQARTKLEQAVKDAFDALPPSLQTVVKDAPHGGSAYRIDEYREKAVKAEKEATDNASRKVFNSAKANGKAIPAYKRMELKAARVEAVALANYWRAMAELNPTPRSVAGPTAVYNAIPSPTTRDLILAMGSDGHEVTKDQIRAKLSEKLYAGKALDDDQDEKLDRILTALSALGLVQRKPGKSGDVRLTGECITPRNKKR